MANKLKLIGLVVALLLGGCVSQPTLEALRAAPAPHMGAGSPAGLLDRRGEFRDVFCAALKTYPSSEDASECDDWLHRIDDEPTYVPSSVQPLNPAPPSDVILITGAFSECFGDFAKPFDSAIGELKDTPHRYRTIVVGGRSSSKHNAKQIADYMSAYLKERDYSSKRPIVLLGYSKGATDALQFVTDFPELAANIDALVSVAGAIQGSPLADLLDGSYHLLFSHLPMNQCESGDADVVHSLRTDIRGEWLQSHPLPKDLRYYSLSAFTIGDQLARSLAPTSRLLRKHDQRNDGQLLAKDTLIPGSVVLGYVNADHWSVAIEIENALGFFARRKAETNFPHAALLKAIVDYVAADVSAVPE